MQNKLIKCSSMLALTVFVLCLLAVGLPRMIQREYTIQDNRPEVLVGTMSAASNMQSAETGSFSPQMQLHRNEATVPDSDSTSVAKKVKTDANGNVLLSLSYLRTVYQAFDLSDGFV